ncbi:unnamed protein product [Xylocopa violacea]|uniref:Uncharacterized protein n=1 Tax=Xylocopa violacea TaxID=135666 RepID=A0ABP1NDD5_XYLVO
MSSALLLILVVAGTYAKPLEQSSDDSINNIDKQTEVDITNVDTSVTPPLEEQVTQNPDDTTTKSKPSLLTWFLTPLTQNLQINPQTIQNRVTQLKETLSNLGLRNFDEPKEGKQLNSPGNLLHLAGVNDPGFYTNRLEPAGFFGGNGWLANKGGILGGPGAILSTGSLLTDYPSAYRRK